MRLSNEAHESQPWRIRDIVPDFTLEDVWQLPAHGGADDFHRLLAMAMAMDPTTMNSVPARALWLVRGFLGRWLDADPRRGSAGGESSALPIPGTTELSLGERLPDDLRLSVLNVDVGSLPFKPLYVTDDEFAAEVSNRTVHAVMHLAWAPRGDGCYDGQMAVYVLPRGAFGRAYMLLIKPFRRWIVYPALLRSFEKTWLAPTSG